MRGGVGGGERTVYRPTVILPLSSFLSRDLSVIADQPGLSDKGEIRESESDSEQLGKDRKWDGREERKGRETKEEKRPAIVREWVCPVSERRFPPSRNWVDESDI